MARLPWRRVAPVARHRPHGSRGRGRLGRGRRCRRAPDRVARGRRCRPASRPGAPPLTLELGVRADPEAVALRRAGRLYADGRRLEAGRTFARYDSLEARVGQAFATWPDGTVDRLNRLAGLHPQKAVVQLNLGVALFWAGLSGCGGRLAGGGGVRAGHAVRDRRRQSSSSRVRARGPGLRDDCAPSRGARRAHACGAARAAAQGPRRASTGSSSTASHCNAWGGSGRRGGCSTRP